METFRAGNWGAVPLSENGSPKAEEKGDRVIQTPREEERAKSVTKGSPELTS